MTHEPRSAGDAVTAALRDLRDEMLLTAPKAERDEPDAVHQLRKLVRRVRSVLGAFEPLYDEAVAEGVRRPMRAFGRELGTVRDLEVRLAFAESAIEHESDAAPALRARLVAPVADEYRRTHTRLVELMASPRSGARRAALDRFLADPPTTELAEEPVDEALVGLLEREASRAVRRVRRAVRAARSSSETDLEELHRARKAGRRLRYAAEAVGERLPEPHRAWAGGLVAAGEDVHDVLGGHRDEVVFADFLRRAAAHAGHEGEPAEPFLRLAERAEERAAARLEELPELLDALRAAGSP